MFDMDFSDKTALICGLGLLGGSLALKLKENGWKDVSALGRNRQRLLSAQKNGVIDHFFTDPEEAARERDLIVLCTPVGIIPNIAAQLAPFLKKDVYITDIGSTKEWICRNMKRVLGKLQNRFIGSHPMAGSEKSGCEYAYTELFQGATVVITPDGTADADIYPFISALWESTGADVKKMDPVSHDRITAATSHLPHASAFALAYYLSSRPEAADNFSGIYGKGLLDTLRIAASDPTMWEDIIKTNRKEIADSLSSYRDTLGILENWIRTGQFDKLVDLMIKSGEICNQLQKNKS